MSDRWSRPSVSFVLTICIAHVFAAWEVSKAAEIGTTPILALDSGGHTATVTRALFTPDERHIISVSQDKTIRIWEFTPDEANPMGTSGETPSRVLRPPIRETILNLKASDGIDSLSISADGKLLAIARSKNAGRKEIDLVSIQDGELNAVLQNDFANISKIAFSPDGKLLAVCGGVGSDQQPQDIILWDISQKQVFRRLTKNAGSTSDITWHPSSLFLAGTCGDGQVRIWDITKGTVVQTFNHAKGAGERFRWTSISWSSNGKRLALGGHEKNVIIAVVNPFDASVISATTIAGLPPDAFALEFAPNSEQLLVKSTGGARLADVKTLTLSTDQLGLPKMNSTCQHAAFSPSGQFVVLAGGDFNEIAVCRTANSKVVQVLGGRGIPVNRVGWSSSGFAIALNSSFDPQADQPLPALTKATMENLAPVIYQWGFDLTEFRKTNLSDVPAGEFNRSIWFQPPNSPPMSLFDHDLGRMMAANFNNAFLVLPVTDEGKEKLAKLPAEVQDQWRAPNMTHDGLIRDITAKQGGRFLATTAADQTVRIFKTGQSIPLLSLFFASAGRSQDTLEWIAWTPEGYYACSPGGEKLMGWHVNNGTDKMASFFPASQFRASLYRPDVIQLLLNAESIEKALEQATQARGKSTNKVEVSQVLPPLARIDMPAGFDGNLERGELQIRAMASSRGDRLVIALRLVVDGRPFEGKAGVQKIASPRIGEATATWSVQLSPGRHRLQVLADCSVSQGASPEIEVTYAGGGVNNEIELPVLYVFAVGISNYPGKLKLDYAAKDAETLVSTFQKHSRALFRKIEVRVLTNERATRGEILKGLNWLRKEVTQRDYAVFSFSGHGQKDADGGLYFLPVDVDPENLSSTAILADQFKLPLTALPGKIVMLLDACHSGGLDAGTTGRRKGTGPLTDDLLRDLITDESGIVVMCSSTGNESSLENNQFRQGNFTLSIAEGLSGKADYNRDGHVYLNELDNYVTDRVKELTKGDQHPVTAKPTSIRSFPLSKP